MTNRVNRFTKISIGIEVIALFNLILHVLTDNSIAMLSGSVIFLVTLLIDVMVITIINIKKMYKTAIGIRYFSILLLSVYIVFFYSKSLLAITVLLLLCHVFDLIFRVDFVDMYSRFMAISVSAFPIALLTIIEQLFFAETGNAHTIEMISVIAALIVMVSSMSKIFIEWIATYEKKLMEQHRMNENANEANESLMLYQDKLRKVNEELGIQKIRVESAIRQVNKSNVEMSLQNDVLKRVSTTISQYELMQNTTQALCETMDLKFCAVSMRDIANERRIEYFENHKDISDEFMAYMRECLTVSRVEDLEKVKKISVDKAIHRLYANALKQQDELAVIITIPIISDDYVEGVIVCGHERQDFFDESHTVFENIAAQILMALKNIKLYYTTQQLAIRDGLTGLYNRRQLNVLVEQYGQKAVKEKKSLTAVLLDIDNFKSFNDSYGHACGDLVLTELAGISNSCAESNNGICARYGGEEFVLVFPDKDMDSTYQIISALQETINNTQMDYAGKTVSVHVSIGISSYPETSEQPEAILNRADAAMYYSKNNGKNRITKDSDEVLAYFRKNSKRTEG